MGFLPDISPSGGSLPSIYNGGGFLPNISSQFRLPTFSPNDFHLPSFVGSGNLSMPAFSTPFSLPSLSGGGGFSLPSFSAPFSINPPQSNSAYGLPSLRPVAGPTTSPGSSGSTSSPLTSSDDPVVAQYLPLINQVSYKTGVPADVLAGIMSIEHPSLTQGPGYVRPDTGAAGLMQVVGGPTDPYENILAAANLLLSKQKAWGIDPNDWDDTAAAYFGAYNGRSITGAADATGTNGYGYVSAFRAARAKFAPAAAIPRTTTTGYVFPVVGYVGTPSLHHGSDPGASDLMAPRGSQVVAMRGGTVQSSGFNSLGGNSVLIHGDDGLDYYYAHMENQSPVYAGEPVAAGTPLGTVGDTGDAKGGPTHLHLGIGYGIANGGLNDPHGGAGNGYNAVSLLTNTLAGR